MNELPGTPIHRLVGIYAANGSLAGELAYWIGARLGRRHCSLCDITHGSLREKTEWKSCRAELSLPFDTYHLDERAPDMIRASEGNTPCVIADTDTGLVVLLGPSALDACDGSPSCLVDAITAAAARQGLTL